MIVVLKSNNFGTSRYWNKLIIINKIRCNVKNFIDVEINGN